MKVLFLDIDGVINTGAGPADPKMVARLNGVTASTGAQIVVHSMRRWSHNLATMAAMLRAYGVSGPVIDLAPTPYNFQSEGGVWLVGGGGWAPERNEAWRGDIVSNDERCIAIQRWLNTHASLVERYVILDDSDELGHFVGRAEFVQTETAVGLTDDLARRAIAVLDSGVA